MFDLPPDEVRAVVVGIHHYDYGTEWELRGPTDDALRMVDWLLGRGIKQDQIALFLSPASWQEQEVMQWVQTNSWTKPLNATQGTIKQFIDTQLAESGGRGLFLYWGGHGLISSEQEENYLLVADSTKKNTYYVNVQALFSSLKQGNFSHLAQQLCIVDACASPCNEVNSEITLSEVNFTSGALKYSVVEQCYFFAASPGKYARNDSVNRSGFFSRNLFLMLPPASVQASMSDFVSIFQEVRTKGELESQTPCMVWIKGRGDLEKTGYIHIMSNAAARLLALIRQVQIEPRRCKRLYLRCLPNSTRLSIYDDLEHWIRDLADVPWPAGDSPSPLVEFAVRVGRETGRVELEQWAKQECKPEQFVHLIARLQDEESEQNISYTTLYLELDEHGKNLRWWLWGERQYLRTAPVVVDLTPQRLHESLKKSLPEILEMAYNQVAGDSELRVSLLLPYDQLSAGLEDIELQLVLDGMPSTESLYQRYPLLLHWNRRANSVGSTSTHAKWKMAVDKLQQRIDQGSGTAIQWLEPDCRNPHEAAKNQLISGPKQAICVGLDGLSIQAVALVKSIQGCLQHGIPCFFWLQQAPTDAERARIELEHSFGGTPARDVPLTLKRLTAEASADSILPTVRIVWDLPAYLPSQNQHSPLIPGI